MTLFDLAVAEAPQFANFVRGQHQAETVQAVERAASGQTSAYIWGRTGAGKSHLLAAARQVAAECGMAVATLGAVVPEEGLLVVDEIDGLDEEAQFQLLAAQKEALREDGGLRLLAAGRLAPRDLELRPDVATRLELLPAFHLTTLSDHELPDALVGHAARRGRALPREVASVLAHFLRRDMASLARAVEALDSYAIVNNEKMNAALARRWLDIAKPKR